MGGSCHVIRRKPVMAARGHGAWCDETPFDRPDDGGLADPKPLRKTVRCEEPEVAFYRRSAGDLVGPCPPLPKLFLRKAVVAAGGDCGRLQAPIPDRTQERGVTHAEKLDSPPG